MMFDKVSFLVLWLTNDCNLRCKYCYANAGERKQQMTFETAKKAIETPKSKFKLQLAGGEPLLNFQLVKDIYEYLKDNKPEVKIQMQTNGALIDKEIAREIKRMNISVGVSLDGPVEINEQLRGETVAVINGIRTLAQAGVMVNLNCVVTEGNVEHLSKLVDLAMYLGNVGGIGLDLLRETGRVNDSHVRRASSSQIRKHVLEAYSRTIELSRITGRRIVMREIEDARKRLREGKKCTAYCHASYGGSMVVLPDGSLYPCGSLSNEPEHHMGNIHDRASQKEARLTVEKPESCSWCKYEKVCPGACPARSIINCKSRGVTAEDCALRKIAFEIVEEEMRKNTN